jgi:hypothetical protein
VRYAALQMLFPDEAKTLHTRLEAEFADRYATLKRKADAEFVAAQPSGELATPAEGDADACTLAGTAEHAGARVPTRPATTAAPGNSRGARWGGLCYLQDLLLQPLLQSIA